MDEFSKGEHSCPSLSLCFCLPFWYMLIPLPFVVAFLLCRNNDRESLQLVAASATAYMSSRLRWEMTWIWMALFGGWSLMPFYMSNISTFVFFSVFSQETKETHDFRLFFFSVSKKICDHLEWQLGRLERVMQRDKLKRFPAPLPKLVAWLIHSPQQWMFLEGNPVLDLAIEYSGKLQIQVVASKQKPIKNS